MNRPGLFEFTRWQFIVLATLLFLAVVCLAHTSEPALAQAEPVPPNGSLPVGADRMFPCTFQSDATTLLEQAAEQNKDIVIINVEALLSDSFRQYGYSYDGLNIFWGEDIPLALYANIGQLMCKWISEGKEIIGALVALIIFMPNKRTPCRSLRSSSLRLILFMTLIGIAFANLTG